MQPILIATAVIVILLASLLISAIKVVREYQRLVVFRLGRVIGTKGPGLVLLIPLVDRATLVDLREFYLEIPHQTAITEDNASISIDFIVFNKVLDAQMSVVTVGNFAGAAQNIASTTLRSVVGDMSLDDVLAKREQMNEVLRVKLDEVTERWGVKVTNVEIREIIPPPAVQEAMTRQMSAERTRRAVVTEAEGSKQAAITVSEGNKQAAILNAEGERQSSILRAEGTRQAAILNAEGFAMALQKINEAAAEVGTNTMRLQYLDALKALGVSPSSKVVVPMELTGLVAAFTAITAGASNGEAGGAAAKT
jgi:regulator of protease activity HflC (stomatin/prohibitin superfamily)